MQVETEEQEEQGENEELNFDDFRISDFGHFEDPHILTIDLL